MKQDEDKDIENIQRKIKITGLIDTLGAIIFGLGLFAKFSAKGNHFHPVLDNESVVTALLVIGAAIMIWGVSRVFLLSKKKNQLACKAKK